MADMKVWRPQGGNELRIETGGTITAAGTQASAIAAIVDNSGGTADGTLQSIGASYSQSEVRNNFADIAAKVNSILTALQGVGILP